MISPLATPSTLGVSDQASRPTGLPLRGTEPASKDQADALKEARVLKETYTQFVGEAFYGQMLKAMRATVGEPAYFHGGSAERQFQSRLDAQLSQDLASDGANGLANQLFENEFPNEAALLREATTPQGASDAPSLNDLQGLRRR